MTKIFAQIIDFRSPFTASIPRVAAVAEKLAELIGLKTSANDADRRYLHDLGKLAVMKSSRSRELELEEFNIVRSHLLYIPDPPKPSRNLKRSISGLRCITNGSTARVIPFFTNHRIFRRSWIMAVADIFTAITETAVQAWHVPESVIETMSVLSAANQSALWLSVVAENFDELKPTRAEAQKPPYEYQKINHLHSIFA